MEGLDNEWYAATKKLAKLKAGKKTTRKSPTKTPKKKARKKKTTGKLKVTRCRRGSLVGNLECTTRQQ